MRRYGFTFKIKDHCVILTTEGCQLLIRFERRERGYFVDFLNPRDATHREYCFRYIMGLRRCYSRKVYTYDQNLSQEDNLRNDLTNLEEVLIYSCSDLLSGDFGTLLQEGYLEYESFISEYTPYVMNLPRTDPVSAKFWKGDLSWVDDLKERLLLSS